MPSGLVHSKPRTELEQAVASLQKKPNDQALRERTIKMALEIKPETPEEARRFIVRAKAAIESKENEDAIREYQKALSVAPWLGDAYYNLALLQQTTGDYRNAIKNYKFYLLAAPDSPDVEKVKDNIYKLEYKAEKKGKAGKRSNAKKATSEALSTLIVPGKSIGPIHLGMTPSEVSRLLGPPDSVGLTGINDYQRLALGLVFSESKGVVNHIYARDNRYATSQGVRVGMTKEAIESKMGMPTTVYCVGSACFSCYSQGDGATLALFQGSDIITMITVVPDCGYR
jgi:tetratricopeptide (TPR) repeat protein